MRVHIVLGSLSRLLMVVGASMSFPLIFSLAYSDGSSLALILSLCITMGVGGLLYKTFPLGDIQLRYIEGYLIVTCGWIVVVLFGSLPYLLSGTMGLTDALFETMSGFTTTGASVLKDIETVPAGILMWRSLTQWLGGMGIIVLFVALIAHFGPGANKIFFAEAAGPSVQKITPRISETAKILWKFYMGFTIVQIVLLLIFGMSLYDSIAHTFTTIATGGFSTKNASVGYYMDNVAVQVIITIFMFLGGANFALYCQALKKKKLGVFFRNEEFLLYFKVVGIAVALVTLSLYVSGTTEQGIIPVTALFQVVSVLTTTGYATVDYDQWPNLARNTLFILLFVGGCFGSTAGGIKIGRFLILVKYMISEFIRSAHPRMVRSIKINGVNVDEKIVMNTFIFFFAYCAILGVSTLVLSGFNLDIESSLTATLACLGVIGPGLGKVGPAMNYGDLPTLAKHYLSFLMLIGRLEIFTVMVLFYPKNWR